MSSWGEKYRKKTSEGGDPVKSVSFGERYRKDSPYYEITRRQREEQAQIAQEERRKTTEENFNRSQEQTQKYLGEYEDTQTKGVTGILNRFNRFIGRGVTTPALVGETPEYTQAREADEREQEIVRQTTSEGMKPKNLLTAYGQVMKKTSIDPIIHPIETGKKVVKAFTESEQTYGRLLGEAYSGETYVRAIEGNNKILGGIRDQYLRETDPEKKAKAKKAMEDIVKRNFQLAEEAGGEIKNMTTRQLVGLSLQVGMDIGSIIPIGKAVKAGVKGVQAVGKLAKLAKFGRAVAPMAGYGAGYGVSEKMKEPGEHKPGEYVKSGAIGAGAGAVLGVGGYFAGKALAGILRKKSAQIAGKEPLFTRKKIEVPKVEKSKPKTKNGILAQAKLNKQIIATEKKMSEKEKNKVFKTATFREKKSPLIQEARKGEVYYHGTPSGFETKDFKGGYLTKDKNYADVYQGKSASSISYGSEGVKNKASGIPRTLEFVMKKDANLFDYTNPKHRALLKDYFGKSSMSSEPAIGRSGQLDWTEGENLADYFKEKGIKFDGIKLDEAGGIDPMSGLEVKRSPSVLITNPKVLKENVKSQPLQEGVETTKQILENPATEVKTYNKLIDNINKKDWWRTANPDQKSISDRGNFYASSYKEAEFYGRPQDTPNKVNIKNPLIGDEQTIMKKLGLEMPNQDISVKERFAIDKQTKELASKQGYDSIALMTPKGYQEYLSSGKIPKSIELQHFPESQPPQEGGSLIQEARKVESGNMPIYHGTPEKFSKFDTNKMEGGQAWFTTSKKDITSGTAGAVQSQGQKLNIMERYVKPGAKFADEKTAEKYYTDQLIEMGYAGKKVEQDGATWYSLFDPNKDTAIKPFKSQPLQEGGNLKPINRPPEAESARIKMNQAFDEINNQAAKGGTINSKKWREANKLADEYWKIRDTKPVSLQEGGKKGILTQARQKVIEGKKEVVKVPKSQLPVGKGILKVSRLEARMKGSLDVNPKEARQMGLSVYKEATGGKERIKKLADYAVNNTDDAMAVLRGEKEPPAGFLRNDVYVALDNAAVGDQELATKLASYSSTRFGQEIETLKNLNPRSPVKYMTELMQRKIDIIGGKEKIAKAVRNQVYKSQKEISKTLANTNWDAFVNSIRC